MGAITCDLVGGITCVQAFDRGKKKRPSRRRGSVEAVTVSLEKRPLFGLRHNGVCLEKL